MSRANWNGSGELVGPCRVTSEHTQHAVLSVS